MKQLEASYFRAPPVTWKDWGSPMFSSGMLANATIPYVLSKSKKRGRSSKHTTFNNIASVSPTLKSPPCFHHTWRSNLSLLSLSQQLHFSEWLKERRKPREKGSLTVCSLPLQSKLSPHTAESDIQILGEEDGSTSHSVAYHAFALSSFCLSFNTLGFWKLTPRLLAWK